DFELHHEDVRRYYSFEYKAKSWKYRQRVIAKIEVSDKGVNVRFIVTSNRNNKPETVYRRYCKRGTMELWIKDLKYFRADRMS
ncbi:transposase, partial [Bacteroides thetaiotaomicron]